MRGTVQDVTEKRIAEEKMRLSARVFSDTHEGIVITDANAIILDVNPSFSEITGYSRDEALGKNPNILKAGRHEAGFYTNMWQILADPRRSKFGWVCIGMGGGLIEMRTDYISRIAALGTGLIPDERSGRRNLFAKNVWCLIALDRIIEPGQRETCL